MTIFTFPSGATVEVPDGLPVCERPESVTYDCRRSIPVGLTSSGRAVFSGFSCAAYTALGAIYQMRKGVADDRARVVKLMARGRTWNANNLQRHITEREARNERIVAGFVANAAPCSCVIPPVRAADLAAELGVPADELRALVQERAGHRPVDESTEYRLAADGELLLMHPEVIVLRMHYTRTPTS
jgi:hypothetical protein